MSRKSLSLRAALLIFGLIAFSVPQAFASSHREALSVLNEPCADNTDTFAWVSNQTHDKLYLIMDFNPLHEPGRATRASAPATATATSSTSAKARA